MPRKDGILKIKLRNTKDEIDLKMKFFKIVKALPCFVLYTK